MIALLYSAALLGGCDSTTGDRGIRVVLITLDTVRYDRFEPSPDSASKMPLTRAHAERGIVFNRYYTVSPVTQPTHATFLTGMQPWEHGITRNGIVLSERFPTVIDVLKQNGFETRAVVASFPLTKRFGFARGFDAWTEDFSHNLSANKSLWEEHWKIESGEFFAIGDSISDRAITELNAATAERQFFWFHYFDPHAPYGASSGGQAIRKRDIMAAIPDGRASVDRVLEEAIGLYDKDVAFLDVALDRVLRKLEDDESRFETHVVVVSDHGESLGEGDSVGHGARLNDAELHVPAFIISPRVTAGTNDDIVASVDVAPTLMSLAGVDQEDLMFAGRDLTQPAAKLPGAGLRAFAMRRTFRESGKVEQRLDGVDYPIDEILFGAVDRTGEIHGGNHIGMQSTTTDLDPATRAEIIAHFNEFHQAFELADPARALTPEVRRALEALGYVE